MEEWQYDFVMMWFMLILMKLCDMSDDSKWCVYGFGVLALISFALGVFNMFTLAY